jgi:hypothetical protein
MVFVELYRRVTLSEIMEAIALQLGEGTDTPVELGEPGGRQRVSLAYTEHHWGEGRHPLRHSRIKAPVTEIE